MRLHDGANCSEAEPAPDSLRRDIRIKQLGHELRLEPRTVVRDLEEHARPREERILRHELDGGDGGHRELLGGEPDVPGPVPESLACVLHEVHEDLPELVGVCIDIRQVHPRGEVYGDVLCDNMRKYRLDVAHEEVGRHPEKRHLAVARELDELPHHLRAAASSIPHGLRLRADPVRGSE